SDGIACADEFDDGRLFAQLAAELHEPSKQAIDQVRGIYPSALGFVDEFIVVRDLQAVDLSTHVVGIEDLEGDATLETRSSELSKGVPLVRRAPRECAAPVHPVTAELVDEFVEARVHSGPQCRAPWLFRPRPLRKG